MSFFIEGDDACEEYAAIRDLPKFYKAKEFIEILWENFKSGNFLEKKTLGQSRKNLISVFWEMLLVYNFQKNGIKVRRIKDGSDFFFYLENKRILIEAVTVGDGEKENAVPESPKEEGIIQAVPIDKTVLRITNAFQTKIDKHRKKDIERGSSSNDDEVIIAINYPYKEDLFAERALIGSSNLIVGADNQVVASYISTAGIKKYNGTVIRPGLSNCPELTAVIYSSAHPYEGCGCNDLFRLFENKDARYKLPINILDNHSKAN